MKSFAQFSAASGSLQESIGPTAVRAGALAVMAKVARLNSEIQSDRSATAAQKRLSSEIASLAGLVAFGIYAVTGDQNPIGAARRIGG